MKITPSDLSPGKTLLFPFNPRPIYPTVFCTSTHEYLPSIFKLWFTVFPPQVQLPHCWCPLLVSGEGRIVFFPFFFPHSCASQVLCLPPQCPTDPYFGAGSVHTQKLITSFWTTAVVLNVLGASGPSCTPLIYPVQLFLRGSSIIHIGSKIFSGSKLPKGQNQTSSDLCSDLQDLDASDLFILIF